MFVGDDFSGLVDITFVPGDTVSNPERCIDIMASEDSLLENDMETLILTLSTTDERITLNPNSTTVTITDIDSECGDQCMLGNTVSECPPSP